MKYFIYFSATGNGDFLASLYEKTGYQPVKVEMVKPIGKMNFFKIFKYGGSAGFEKKAKIKSIELQINSDDEVVIGSPIWNDCLSTPINTVLAIFDLNKETTGFVLYPAGKSTKKSLVQLEKLGFKKQPIVVSNPLKNQEETIKLLGL